MTHGRRIAIGTGILLPLAVFSALVVEARMRETPSWDRDLSSSLYRYNPHGTFLTHATGLLEGVIGRPAQIGGLLVLAALLCFLAWRRRFRAVLLIVAAVAGTLVLEPVIKDLVRRPAPHPGNSGYAFPSGTAMRSMAAAAAVTTTAWRSQWRWPAAAVGTVTVGLVGLGIVFDGWHFASDVIGGWCLSIAWVTVLALTLRPEGASKPAGRFNRRPAGKGRPSVAERTATLTSDRPMLSDRDRTTEVIRHHWDRRADDFDEEIGHGLFSEEQRRAWHEVLSRLVDRTPARVLDVGCGTGFLALRFAELGHEATGVDLSSRMIERARSKAEREDLEVEFLVGDAVALDIPDETYDLVIARHVIWNLPEPERGVAEWLRVLRPEGRLALVEGKWADNDPNRRSHVSRALSSLKDVGARVLDAAGFPTKELNREYSHVEYELPFSGGPSEARLANFLKANSVHEVAIEPLPEPALWGGPPEFPRYLATGTRARRERQLN